MWNLQYYLKFTYSTVLKCNAMQLDYRVEQSIVFVGEESNLRGILPERL